MSRRDLFRYLFRIAQISSAARRKSARWGLGSAISSLCIRGVSKIILSDEASVALSSPHDAGDDFDVKIHRDRKGSASILDRSGAARKSLASGLRGSDIKSLHHRDAASRIERLQACSGFASQTGFTPGSHWRIH